MVGRHASLTVTSALLLAAWCGSAAAAPCEPSLVRSLAEARARLGAVSVSKPGQARVFAADGTEYTAGAALRMTAEARLAEQACGRDAARLAAGYVAALSGTLRAPIR